MEQAILFVEGKWYFAQQFTQGGKFWLHDRDLGGWWYQCFEHDGWVLWFNGRCWIRTSVASHSESEHRWWVYVKGFGGTAAWCTFWEGEFEGKVRRGWWVYEPDCSWTLFCNEYGQEADSLGPVPGP